MADVAVLRRTRSTYGDATSSATPKEAPESDRLAHAGIVRATAGTGQLYTDNNTTQVDLATGTGVTAINIGTSATPAKTITIGADTDDSTTINGDLTITGTTTTISATNLQIADQMIGLGDGAASGLDSGIAIERGATGDDAVLLWEEGADRFELGFADTDGGGGVGTSVPGAIASGSFAPLAIGDALTLDDGGAGTAAIATTSGDNLTVTATGASATLTFGARGATILLNEVGDTTLDGGFSATSIIGALNELYGVVATPVSLQGAYENGNTIVTDSGNGAFDVSGTEAISLDTTGLAANFNIAANSGSNATLVIGAANAGAGAGNIDIDAKSAITMDSASFSVDGTGASNVTTNTGDLTLSSTAGSVVITGGEAVADAVRINTSNAAGGIDVDAGTAGINMTSTGDVTILSNTSNVGSLTIEAGGNSDVIITADNNVDINAFGAGVTVDGAAISVDGTDNSNVSVTGADLVISTITSGELDLTSAGLMDVNAGANLDIDVTGTYTMDSTGAFSIDGTGASNVTAASGNLTLATTTSGNVVVNAAATVDIDGATSVLIDGGAFSVDSTGASNVSVTGDALTISTITSGNLIVSAASALDMDAVGAATLDAASFSVDSTSASNVTVTGADLTVSTVTSGALILTSAGLMDVNAGANLDIDVTGTFDMLSSGAFSIDGTGASNVTAASGNLTVSTTTSGNVVVDSAAAVDINAVTIITVDAPSFSIDGTADSNLSVKANGAGAATLLIESTNDGAGAGHIDVNLKTDFTLDSTAGSISLDSVTASNFTVSGATADLTLGARGATITLNEAGETTLDGGFTATSIIGALNELYDSVVAIAAVGDLQNDYTAAVNLSTGHAVYISTTDTVNLASAATDGIASRFIGISEAAVTAAAEGVITTEGIASARFVTGLTLNAGDEVFLSTTAGSLTNVVPEATGNVQLSVGFVRSVGAYDGVTNLIADVQLIRGPKLVAG